MPDLSERYVALTLTAGLDAEIPLSPRVTLVPTSRIRWVKRPRDGMGFYAGSGTYVFQFGAVVRATF
jgi:hypothetical protein